MSNLTGRMPTRGIQNPIPTKVVGQTEDKNYKTLIDDSASTTIYIGEAVIGSASSSAVWRIQKIITSTGSTSITWAAGSDTFTNIWDNRASLSYS